MLQSYIISEAENRSVNADKEVFRTLVDALRDAVGVYEIVCGATEVAVVEVLKVKIASTNFLLFRSDGHQLLKK